MSFIMILTRFFCACVALPSEKQRNYSTSKIIGVHIDHGLRPEASEEAAKVKEWIKDIGNGPI